ncbi:MAG TPA: YihY/virulence factor BrkB family protein, partial [Ignavibacteriaceae bacterium]
LIIFAVLGNILDSSYVQFQINTLIETIIPYSRYSEFVKKIIFNRISEVIEYRNIAGIIGGFGLLFAASSLFSSMRTILNKVYGVETDVNILIAKLRDFALVFMVIIIFFMTTILMPTVDLLREKAGEWAALGFLSSGLFSHLIFSLLSLLLIFIVFSVLYFTVPLRKLGRKATFMSALWAAILWEAAKQLFGYYLYNFAAFNRIYGAYALIVVVAFWIYYSSVVFIIGAEIGFLYFERNFLKNNITT